MTIPFDVKQILIYLTIRMEYKPVPEVSLVVGQRYYIVPKSRLLSNKLVKIVNSTTRYSRFDAQSLPEAKKMKILLLSAVLDSKGAGWSSALRFSKFWNKNNEPASDTRKSTDEQVYFSFTPTPVPTVMGSTVTAEDAKKTIGELSENVIPESMRAPIEAEAGAGSVTVSAPEIRTVMSPAVKKTTDELITTLRLGEARVSISDILKRKNAPQLENLTNRLLHRTQAMQILPSDYPMPPYQYYGDQHVKVYSPYGAIELLIESQRFTHDQKAHYIRELVNKGADPSKALVTAILHNNIRALNVLLDLGADPNYVSEYKTTDGTQRFLTSPLLVAIPTRMTEVNDVWVYYVHSILKTLIQHRTFVMDERDGLTLMNRNSVPDGTPVYETVAFITPKLLGTFRERLNEHADAITRYSALPKRDLRVLEQLNKYAEILKGCIHYLEEEAVKQGALLAEPGGPAYEEARARAYGNKIGTREEQLARNRAANESVHLSISSFSNEHVGSTALADNGVRGGTRKQRRPTHRRQTRR